MIRFALIATAALAIAGCGEKEQVVVYEPGKYQGKPDNRSWDNPPPSAELRGGEWKQGDRATWEDSIKHRQMGQNEYRRMGQ
jgi:hypothetical protein